jgi:hypothetical protein
MSRVLDASEIIVDRGPFEMIPHWLLDAEVSPLAIRLYLILRRHGDAQAFSYPGRRRLAELTQASVKSVDRAKDELVEVGAICYVRRHSDDGDWTSNLYHVHWESSLACVVSDATSGQKRPHGRDKNDPTGRDKNDTLTKTHLEPRPNEQSHRFDEFWRAYPRRQAKGDALKAWKKAVKEHNQQMIITAARQYAESYAGDPQFIPLPATWLNGQRWLDEKPKPKQSGPIPIMDLYADEPCEHGDPLGEARCPLCRRK